MTQRSLGPWHVAAIDADGVMLDTMAAAPDALIAAVNARRRGVVFAPELRIDDADLGRYRQSWAQWFETGDDSRPAILRQTWLEPRHRQLTIRRWDRSRRRDVGASFWGGAGLLLWDNVFGAHNPYSRSDRRLIAETGAVLDRYGDLIVHAAKPHLHDARLPRPRRTARRLLGLFVFRTYMQP
ncbi:MAG: hypothetical protein KIT84_09670 [Labilithrix sp.]|nr:hypothetical protein [Labilithrix sp.]MCW5811269.1 hypothetical protein [Labilithrix sp.]